MLPERFYDTHLHSVPGGYDVDTVRNRRDDIPFLTMLWNESLAGEERLRGDSGEHSPSEILRQMRDNLANGDTAEWDAYETPKDREQQKPSDAVLSRLQSELSFEVRHPTCDALLMAAANFKVPPMRLRLLNDCGRFH